MFVHVYQDWEPDWVHIDKKFRDKFVINNSLWQELSTFVCYHIVTQVDWSNLKVLLKEIYKGLDCLRCHSIFLQVNIN